MMNLIRSFVRHRVAANILMMLVLVSGIAAGLRLNTQMDPDVQFEFISVVIPWPGASANDVDRSIVEGLEPRLRYLDGIDSVGARSREGVAEFFLNFNRGTNMNKALSEVESAINSLTTLPQSAEEPIIHQGQNTDYIMSVVISGDVPEAALREHAKKIRNGLLARGVDEVNLMGLRDSEIWVEVPAAELRRLDTSLGDISRRLGQTSQDLPSGSLTGGIEKQIRAMGQQDAAAGVADLTLRVDEQGRRITLGDIANVQDTFEESGIVGRRNGMPAIEINIFRAAGGGDIIQMTEVVDAYIEQVKAELPPTIKLEIYQRIADYLGDRIGLLVSNGLGGLILVVGTLWLFLRPRITLWVAVGIPVSLAAVFVIMLALGQTINMISLFALIMVMGIIVDDAIVVAERAQSLHEAGHTPEKAAELAGKQMFWPVTAASLTTIAAFSPMFIISGQTGGFILPIPMIAVAVIAASLVECFLILPYHLKKALAKDSGKSSKFRLAFERGFTGFRDGRFNGWVQSSTRNRYTTLAAMLALMIVGFGLISGGRIPFTFMPSPESQWVKLNVLFSPGTPREVVAEQLDLAEQAIFRVEQKLGYEEGKLVTLPFGRIGQTMGGPTVEQVGDYIGAMSVELIPADKRADRVQDIVKMWEQETLLLPGIDQVYFTVDEVGFSGPGIGWRLTHDDMDLLKQASQELQAVLSTYEGVSNIRDNIPYGKPELLVRVTPRGEALGFTTENVGRQLRDALDGAIAKRFARGDEEVTVRVRLPEADQSEEALRNLFLRSPTGAHVPLRDVVELEERPGLARIFRDNGQRIVAIFAEVDVRVANSNDIRERVEKEELPRILEKYGLSKVEDEGERQMNTFFADFQAGLIVALGGIYLILAWIMGSYARPLAVMAVIPFGMVGAIWGHWVMGYDLTMFSYIALMGLSGILVNDAILVVDTVKDYQKEGMPLEEAVVKASRDRLRPVLLTSLTTIGGLLPLLFETNLQAQFLIPMAITLVFGLAIATALVLILVPSLLLALDDGRRGFGRLWGWITRMARWLIAQPGRKAKGLEAGD